MLKQIIFLLFFISSVLSACLNGTLEYQSNCYYFNTTETGFEAAEISCINFGGHLASIHNAFENGMIGQEGINYFHGSTDSDLWIGANKLFPNGKWNWTDGSAFDFTDWGKGEPQNISGANCAALSMTDGTWSAQDCFKTKPFVCQIPNIVATTTTPLPLTGNCSFGWFYIPQAHACYGSNGGAIHEINWTTAQSYCESIPGAQLPSVHSVVEFQYLINLVFIFWRNVWSGIFSVDGGKVWKNSDGTPADFINYGTWCDNRPLTNVTGQRCVAVLSGCFYDSDCLIAANTICKIQL